MAFTYKWELNALKKQNYGNFENIIIGTNWKLTGTDEDGNSGVFSGATPFKPQDLNGDGFVDYYDLTEELVLSWVKSVVTGSDSYMEHINAQIQKEIDNKKYAKMEVGSADLPWAPQSGSTTYPAPASGSMPGY